MIITNIYPEITGSFLERKLRYNPDTGDFIKIDKSWGRQKTGDKLGCISKHNGYVYLTLGAYHILAHRLAWIYMTGKWPVEHIDHINSIRHDNNWNNLREATNAQNLWGSRLQIRNSSGKKGVMWSKTHQRWDVFIGVNKRSIYLGRFKELEKAIKAREEGEKRYHKEFSK